MRCENAKSLIIKFDKSLGEVSIELHTQEDCIITIFKSQDSFLEEIALNGITLLAEKISLTK